MKLFGPHGVTISNSAHFLSDFNALLQDVVMCFADEAYWAGDPKKVGQLQGMITGRRQTTQRKGVDTFASKSFLHLIFGTNDEHAVPASTDERRFAVPTISVKMKGNRAYWTALAGEIASDHFTGALLHFLQSVDLTGFHPTHDCPVTEGLRDQVAKSLQGLPAWWMEVLAQGYAARSKYACDELEQWHKSVTKDFLRDSYKEWRSSKDRVARQPPYSDHTFGAFMKKVGVIVARLQTVGVGIHGEKLEGARAQVRTNPQPMPGYRLRTLDEMRKIFEEEFPLVKVPWSDEGETEEGEVEVKVPPEGDYLDVPF